MKGEPTKMEKEKFYKVLIIGNNHKLITDLDFIFKQHPENYIVNDRIEDYETAIKTYKYVIRPNVIGVLKGISKKFVIELIELTKNEKYNSEDKKSKRYISKILRKRIYG